MRIQTPNHKSRLRLYHSIVPLLVKKQKKENQTTDRILINSTS